MSTKAQHLHSSWSNLNDLSDEFNAFFPRTGSGPTVAKPEDKKALSSSAAVAGADPDLQWSNDLSDELNAFNHPRTGAGPTATVTATAKPADKKVLSPVRAKQVRQKLANVQDMKSTMKTYQRQVSDRELDEPDLQEDVATLMASLTEFENIMKTLQMTDNSGGSRRPPSRSNSGSSKSSKTKNNLNGMGKRVRSTPSLLEAQTVVPDGFPFGL